jgi:hypothetical protein
LSQSEVPHIEVAIKAGAVPLLVQFLSFGSSDKQIDQFALEKCELFAVMQLDVFIICIAFVCLCSCELFVLWISLMLLLQLLETPWCLTNIAAGQPE